MRSILAQIHRIVWRLPWANRYWHRLLIARQMRKAARRWGNPLAAVARNGQPRTVLFSRFGEETVGNVFIQLGLLRACFHAFSDRPVVLLSSAPGLTRSGLDDVQSLLVKVPGAAPLLGFIRQNVIVEPRETIGTLAQGDLAVLGGGPIMDDAVLAEWRSWFHTARRARAGILIAGCGFGPLRYEITRRMARELAMMADVTVVRNLPVEGWTSTERSRLRSGLDPAFLCAPLLKPLVTPKERILAVNARSIGFDSRLPGGLQTREIVDRIVRLADGIRLEIKPAKILPFSMQEGVPVPDSTVTRDLAETLSTEWDVEVLPMPEASPETLVKALLTAEAVLSTRMHGLIVGLMAGCRAAGLDYIWGGGKTMQLYRDWLGHDTSPSLYRVGSLREEHFLSISDLSQHGIFNDGLLDLYVSAMRAAVSH